MQEALVLELRPEGAIEEQLVDRIEAALWRLRRLGRVEADIFEFEAISRELSDAKAQLRELEDEHRPLSGLDFSLAENKEPKAYKAAAAKVSATEPKRQRSKDHLRHVASLPCLVCGRSPSQAHHIRYAQPRAMGKKVSDEWTVPLCATHHRALHDAGDERAWWV